MGNPPGFKIFRHRGAYFRWFHSHQPYEQEPGLGWELWNMIPTDKDTFQKWVQEKRSELDRIGEECEGRNEPHFEIVDNYYVDSSMIQYEIDLDRLLFKYSKTSLFHLDNKPPLEIFHSIFQDIHYYGAEWGAQRAPKKYRVDLARLPVPEIDDNRLDTYARFCSGVVAIPHDILSLYGTLSSCEEVCLRVLENHVGVYLDQRLELMMQEIILSPDFGYKSRDITLTLATAALLPLHLFGPDPTFPSLDYIKWPAIFAGSQDDFWFIRKHICIAFTMFLHDQRKMQADISAVVDKIRLTSDGLDVVYGVVFSLISCVVVRVDKTAGGFFEHTEVLPFLPSLDADTWSTPGMELLRRLGNLPAADDVDWFHSKLSSMWWSNYSLENIFRSPGHSEGVGAEEPPRKKCKISKNTNGPHDKTARPEATEVNIPRLPIEILAMIARHIANPDRLFNFALASRSTMVASIPRLRYPQIRGRFTEMFSPRTCSFSCFLESYDSPAEPHGASHSSIFRTRFCGFPALVTIAPVNGYKLYIHYKDIELPGGKFKLPHTPQALIERHPEFGYELSWAKDTNTYFAGLLANVRREHGVTKGTIAMSSMLCDLLEVFREARPRRHYSGSELL